MDGRKHFHHVLAVVVIAGASLFAGSWSAQASLPEAPTPAPSIGQLSPQPMTAIQSAARETVAQFVSAHPQPNTSSKVPSEFAAQSAALYNYWKTAPIADWYGQWGCTVGNIAPSMQTGDDGVSRATVGFSSHCPPGVDPSVIGSAISARPATSVTASSAVSPQVTVHNCSSLISAGYHCYSLDTGAHTLINTYTYEGTGSVTGHVRVGQLGIGACANGTFLGNSGNQTLTAGSGVSLIIGTNVDSNWSNSFYYSNNTFRSRYCYAA